MRPRLSIGARWTLRYAVATSILLGVFSVLLYDEVRERTTEDAALLIRLQMTELGDELTRRGENLRAIEQYVESHVSAGAADLKLGIRLFDPEGSVLLERGGVAGLPMPTRFPTGPAGPIAVQEVDLGEKYPYYVSLLPGAGGGWIQVSIYSRPFLRTALEIRDFFWAAMLPMLAAIGLFGWWLARSSLRPLADMDATARHITASRLDERIPIRGTGDELDRLAVTLNAMIDRIEQSVSSLRRFSANAAHELRAPLSRLRNRLEDAAVHPRDAAADQKLIEDAIGDVDRLAGLVRTLLELARCEAGLPEETVREVDVGDLLESIAAFFEPLATEREVEVRCQVPADLRVRGEPAWLRQLFANLVDNAVKYSKPGGRVTLDAYREGGHVVARVHDLGVGIPTASRERIFEHLDRGAQSGDTGSGLGLTLVRQIARIHGGEVAVESDEGQGSTFSVSLPEAP